MARIQTRTPMTDDLTAMGLTWRGAGAVGSDRRVPWCQYQMKLLWGVIFPSCEAKPPCLRIRVDSTLNASHNPVSWESGQSLTSSTLEWNGQVRCTLTRLAASAASASPDDMCNTASWAGDCL